MHQAFVPFSDLLVPVDPLFLDVPVVVTLVLCGTSSLLVSEGVVWVSVSVALDLSERSSAMEKVQLAIVHVYQ